MYQSTPSNKIDNKLLERISRNCEISDATDHGVYSMCSMVLKLRNLYKWERGIEPWQEPEAGDLLDWIETKENSWEAEVAGDFLSLSVHGREVDPFDIHSVNEYLSTYGLYYGAGYGRSMKSVFFVGEVVDRYTVRDCPVVVMGHEHVREMAAPFAMSQDGTIIIRLEPLRFFLWDHFQELQSSCKSSLLFTLKSYGLLTDGRLDSTKLSKNLDRLVESELDLFIHHEIGELSEDTLDSERARAVIGRFPGSVIEFVGRAVKDVLADTHPEGVLTHISKKRKASTLSLYVSFLDGLRQELFPEMDGAWKDFVKNNDWQVIEDARVQCRIRLQETAVKIAGIVDQSDTISDKELVERFNEDILVPMGLEMPVEAITERVG